MKSKEEKQAYAKKWREDNTEKVRGYSRASYRRNPEKALLVVRNLKTGSPEKYRAMTNSSVRKCKYGITEKQYKKLVDNQGGLCRLCMRPGRGKRTTLCIDHNHKTGKIRGLLCASCNMALGGVDDDTELLLRMVEYLKSDGADIVNLLN